MGFFDKLKQGLSKTKSSFEEKMNNVFSTFRKVDEDLLEELEEVLIMSDVGVETSTKIISNLRDRVKKEKLENAEDVKQALRDEIKDIFGGRFYEEKSFGPAAGRSSGSVRICRMLQRRKQLHQRW